MIHVDREDVEEPAGAGGVHCVARVVSVGPGIGSGMEMDLRLCQELDSDEANLSARALLARRSSTSL